MNGKKKIIILAVCIIILLIIFCTYNFIKKGNTSINKSEEEIVDKILNIKSYNAKLDIEIETNKNKTKYVVKQNVENNNSTQEVLEPSNIAGVITKYDGTNLSIMNKKLELETVFKDYSYIAENRLWLNEFVEEFRNSENAKKTSTENEIVLEIQRNKENKYNANKKLYIDKTTGKPKKMIVKDVNQKVIIYILYTEIEIS